MFFLAGALLTFVASTSCPTAAEIVDEMKRRGDVLRNQTHIQTRVEEALFKVSVVDAGGNVLFERDLPDSSSCEAKKNAAVAIVATWLHDLSATHTQLAITKKVRPKPSAYEAPFRFRLGASAALAYAKPQFVFGASLFGELAATPFPLLANFGVLGHTATRATLNQGSIAWWRLGAVGGIGAPFRFAKNRFEFAPQLRAFFGGLSASSSGFSENKSIQLFEFGVGANLRLSANFGPKWFNLFIEFGVWVWPQVRHFSIQNESQTITPGFVDGFVCLGFFWGT